MSFTSCLVKFLTPILHIEVLQFLLTEGQSICQFNTFHEQGQCANLSVCVLLKYSLKFVVHVPCLLHWDCVMDASGKWHCYEVMYTGAVQACCKAQNMTCPSRSMYVTDMYLIKLEKF